MDQVNLSIDAVEIAATPGTTVLDAALGAGIYIPHLCHHPDLKPAGVCRLCMVEIAGRGTTPACLSPVEEGMVVRTESPEIRDLRRVAAELLILDHRPDCLVCAKNNRCELQRVAAHVGIDAARLARLRRHEKTLPVDDSNPFFTHDPQQCVLCGICVRTCNEIAGVNALDFAFRGFDTMVATFGNDPLVKSRCESCGECVVRCPVGALAAKDFQQPSREVKTICPYCGTGCGLLLGVRGNRIVGVRGDPDSSVNRGILCVKGRFGIDFVNHPDRLSTPLIRDPAGGSRFPGFREASWDEALGLAARSLAAIRNQYGPAAIMGISSSRGTNEESYLFQKFMRAVVGTNNVDNCARVCHSPSVTGLSAVFGSGAATNPLDDIEETEVLFLVGCSPTEAHPVIGMRIQRAIAGNGVRLIVADPRKTRLAQSADPWLPVRPGTNVALLNGLAHVILREGLHDERFIAARTEGFESFAEKVQAYAPDRVAAITGIPAGDIEAAARRYAQADRAMILYGLGVTEHSDGSLGVMGCANLALLTGNVGRKGTGVNPLRGQNNVQGACDMGALPNVLPGYQSLEDEAVRGKFEAAWNCKLPVHKGLKYTEAWHFVRRGRVRAAYIVGHNPALTDPYLQRVEEALAALDFLVVNELFLTKTARLAHVVLPAASFAEKEGTFINADRQVQRVRKAVDPPAGCKTDVDIICELADRMGYAMPARTAADLMDEIAAMVPLMAGIRYPRLEEHPLAWPCLDEKDCGSRMLYEKSFPRGRATFRAIDHAEPAEAPDASYPLILTTGRRLQHYNCGSMTRCTPGLSTLCPEERLEIHPQDAAGLNVREDEMVEVASRRGKIRVRARVTDRCSPGVVFLSFHFEEVPTNALTGDRLDPMACTPEYKVSAVRVAPVEGANVG
ncbi:MAG: formate dehydrogenase subunit alpha [Pirellulales bacterium]|nr:formate dehydrogenase subunit alpha [Pirellulales bacterium]